MFNSSVRAFDQHEREQERNRMREHVEIEMDTNKDHVVDLEEFLSQLKRYKNNEKKGKKEEWKVSVFQNFIFFKKDLFLFF